MKRVSSDNVRRLHPLRCSTSCATCADLDSALTTLYRAWALAVPHLSWTERSSVMLQVRESLGLIALVATK